MTLFLIFAGIGISLFLCERLFPQRTQKVLRRGLLSDCLYAPVHFGLRLLLNFFLAYELTAVGRELFPGATDLLQTYPAWFQVAVLLFTLDFVFYLMHRAKHRYRWWWRLHETHHSSDALDFMSSVRFHPLEKILDRLVYMLPLIVLGAEETALMAWSAIEVASGMFIHANTRFGIGPLIYVFVGPEMHQWHHALAREHQDANFGNVLSIFDWLFGTAYVGATRPDAFGIPAEAYPHDNIVGQFLFAFRPIMRTPTADEPVAYRSGRPEVMPSAR